MFMIDGKKVWLRNKGYNSKCQLLELKEKTAKYAEEGLNIFGRKVYSPNSALAKRYREMSLLEFLNYFGMILRTERNMK